MYPGWTVPVPHLQPTAPAAGPAECPYSDRRGEAHTVAPDEYGTCRRCGASRADRARLWRQLGQENPEPVADTRG